MRIQPTPLRVERDRAFFMCYTHLEGVPDLGSAARLMRNSLGGSYVILLGLGSGGLASRDCVPGRARHARRCPNKPPTPPPRAAPADYRPARPDHLPVPAPTILKKACRPTCAFSRRRSGDRDRPDFAWYTCLECISDQSEARLMRKRWAALIGSIYKLQAYVQFRARMLILQFCWNKLLGDYYRCLHHGNH